MNRWRRRFLARVLGFVGATQVPAMVVAGGLLGRATGLGWGVTLSCALAVHVGAAMILVHRIRWWIDDVRPPWWRTWGLEVPYAVYGSACFLAAPLGWLLLLAGAMARWNHLAVPWFGALAAVHAVALAVAAWGTTASRAWLRVTQVDVEVHGLPAAFEGYRIAHLSDVHCGPYVPRAWLDRWAARVARLAPDAVALTGDLITAGEGYLDDVAHFAQRLGAAAPVYACMGNHDYFQTDDGVVRALDVPGVTLLRNASTTLQRGDARLRIAGLDDRWSERADLDATLRDDPAVCTVLLAHDPAGFPAFAARGVALTLSGHTHAGQFAVPFVRRVNLGRLVMRFSEGLFRVGSSALFVSRGAGTTGVPTRVGAAPEVAVLTLRAVGGTGVGK